MRCVIAAAIAVVFTLPGGGSAHADLVRPPRHECIDGTRESGGHGVHYCVPKACQNDADCKDGTACRERAFCVRKETKGTGRRIRVGPPIELDSVMGRCEKGDGSACKSSQSMTGNCRSFKVCVTAEPTPERTPDKTPPPEKTGKTASSPPPEPKSSCAGAGLGGDTLALALALLLLALWRRRVS